MTLPNFSCFTAPMRNVLTLFVNKGLILDVAAVRLVTNMAREVTSLSTQRLPTAIDYGVKKHMFVVRVLPGDYAPGSTSFVHPPPRNPKDPFELFDSCVDNLQNPNIYVIFTFDQVYPEYIIEYEKSGI